MEGQKQVTTLKGHLYSVESVAFSPDGKLLASGGGENDINVRLWDLQEQKEIAKLEEPRGVVSVFNGAICQKGGRNDEEESFDRLYGDIVFGGCG